MDEIYLSPAEIMEKYKISYSWLIKHSKGVRKKGNMRSSRWNESDLTAIYGLEIPEEIDLNEYYQTSDILKEHMLKKETLHRIMLKYGIEKKYNRFKTITYYKRSEAEEAIRLYKNGGTKDEYARADEKKDKSKVWVFDRATRTFVLQEAPKKKSIPIKCFNCEWAVKEQGVPIYCNRACETGLKNLLRGKRK